MHVCVLPLPLFVSLQIHREKENLYPIDSCTAPGLLEEKQSSESAGEEKGDQGCFISPEL